MKITKRQLRRIIKEYGGRPYDPTIPGDYDRARFNPTGDAPAGDPEWDAKLDEIAHEVGDRAAGGYEPSIDGSPEAYADMILDWYAKDPPPPLDKMEDLAFALSLDRSNERETLAFALSKPGYRGYIKEKVLEYIGMMTEGRKMKISKRQLKRIIKETLQSVLSEVVTPELPYDKTPFRSGGYFGPSQLDMFDSDLDSELAQAKDPKAQEVYQKLLDAGLNPKINILDVIELGPRIWQKWFDQGGSREIGNPEVDAAKTEFVVDRLNRTYTFNMTQREEDERAYEAERDPSL